MGIGLGDVFKFIVEELGEDLKEPTKMIFGENKNEFPIPLKKPFWEDDNEEYEVNSIDEISNDNDIESYEDEAEDIKASSYSCDTSNNKKSLDYQLSKLKKNEDNYDYLKSIEKEELKRGIIMAEILGKPRCKQKMRRRF